MAGTGIAFPSWRSLLQLCLTMEKNVLSDKGTQKQNMFIAKMLYSSSLMSHPLALPQQFFSQEGKIGAGVRRKLQFYHSFITLEEIGAKRINFFPMLS